MTGTVFFGSNEYSVGERDGFVSVTVVRTGDTSGAVNVTFATNPSSATSDADYTSMSSVATIAAGANSVTIDIPILDDGLSESTETFAVSIVSIDSGTLLFPRNTIVKILDDENPATEPNEPPLVSDYDVTVDEIITGLDQPMSIVWLPGSDDLALIAQKKGQIAIVNTETGEVWDDLLIDLNAEVNSNSDRGLMDIAIHPDFENNPYLYAFYVVDPAGAAGTGGNDGEDGDGNRYSHVVRWELDLTGGTPSLVAGSKTVILGTGGQSFADISGNGNINSTLPQNIGLPDSEIDPATIDPVTGEYEYKQDYLKVDSITHAGGALAFGPDGMLYVSVGDGASYNFVDPRAVSVQDVNSLSGKILRVDPLTGQGLADNPFADAGDLDANASKVWMFGLRNPFTMTFADDGRLFMSETGWYTYEEVNAGGAGSNFGWPYFEGADLGILFPAPGYQDLPGADDFYDQVNAGNIVITPAYRSLSHYDGDPGFQVNAIVGASSIYTGNRYPSEFLNDYFFTDIVEGEIYAVDINDRTKLKFVTDIGDFGPSQMVQGADGYMYLLDLIGGRVLRLEIENETPAITSNGGGANVAVSRAENTTAVTTVVASDPDSVTIVYTIDGGADAGKFQIDAGTGELSFKSAPNFEAPTDVGANNTYQVIVRASDGNTSDTQTVVVTVTNANDAPVITSNGGNATAAITVAENTTTVTTVTSTDADVGSTRTFSIVGGADFAKFTINSSTGVLSFVSAPNFEAPTDSGTNNVYNVTVQVSDGGLTDTQAIAVTVTNVNDAPIITSNGAGSTASVSVSENTTAVTTVTSTDPDAGASRTFSIVNVGDGAKFNIDPNSGALTFKAAPNFEAPTDSGGNNVYEVTVQVSDGTLTDTQTIAVTVTNVNEHMPLITSNGGSANATVDVAENTTSVTTVTATDADAGASLTYSITGGADQARFTINASTGALTFISAPDYEVRADAGSDNVYDVTVQVSDGSKTDTQTIAVTVNNVPETGPTITSNGGGPTAAVSIAENTTAVTTVVASQGDTAAPIAYAISGGTDAAKFEINATTGVLRFKNAPDHEAPGDSGENNIYDVQVRASDGTFAYTQNIAVTVTNVSDGAPAIVSNGGGATATVAVLESNTAVTTVVATDPDAGTSLTFSITGGADRSRFIINAATGALVFAAPPDFEAPKDVGGNNVYDVQVQASDGSLTDIQSIAVVVGNRNEAPKITSNGGAASASIAVKENASAVATIKGSDPDASTKLTFAIAGGADADKFAVNASTGALTFIQPANFELPTDANVDNRYQVVVEVSDGNLSARQALSVSITDVGGETIIGSKKSDTLRAADGGESVVRGGNDDDVLLGTEWDEHLDGGKGKDKLYGGNGWDVLDGGPGKDLLVGGPHGDAFRFASALGNGNVDKVTLFSPYYDRIELDIGVFPALRVGVLESKAFRVGSKAADPDDRIIYDMGSGALFYDRDGNGAARQVKFAILANKPDKLHEGDFLVI